MDDPIDKATYFRKCWTNSEIIQAYHFKTLCADGDKVFTRYEVDWKANPKFKFPCMEYIEFEKGKIARIHCYFGFVPELSKESR